MFSGGKENVHWERMGYDHSELEASADYAYFRIFWALKWLKKKYTKQTHLMYKLLIYVFFVRSIYLLKT